MLCCCCSRHSGCLPVWAINRSWPPHTTQSHSAPACLQDGAAATPQPRPIRRVPLWLPHPPAAAHALGQRQCCGGPPDSGHLQHQRLPALGRPPAQPGRRGRGGRGAGRWQWRWQWPAAGTASPAASRFPRPGGPRQAFCTASRAAAAPAAIPAGAAAVPTRMVEKLVCPAMMPFVHSRPVFAAHQHLTDVFLAACFTPKHCCSP